jgi:hypothetical protein
MEGAGLSERYSQDIADPANHADGIERIIRYRRTQVFPGDVKESRPPCDGTVGVDAGQCHCTRRVHIGMPAKIVGEGSIDLRQPCLIWFKEVSVDQRDAPASRFVVRHLLTVARPPLIRLGNCTDGVAATVSDDDQGGIQTAHEVREGGVRIMMADRH